MSTHRRRSQLQHGTVLEIASGLHRSANHHTRRHMSSSSSFVHLVPRSTHRFDDELARDIVAERKLLNVVQPPLCTDHLQDVLQRFALDATISAGVVNLIKRATWSKSSRIGSFPSRVHAILITLLSRGGMAGSNVSVIELTGAMQRHIRCAAHTRAANAPANRYAGAGRSYNKL